MSTMMIAMLLCGYPILWIMVGVFASQAKIKKDRSFGLRFPEDEAFRCDAEMIIGRCRKMLLLCGILLSLLVVPMFFISYESVLFTAWLVWFMLVIVIPILIYGHYFQCVKKLKMAKGLECGDDERYWHWGILYVNKDDHRTLIPHGTGNAINMGRLPGKIAMTLVVLCVATLPLWGVWILVEDFTEAKVVQKENAVIAEHLATEYTVAYDDVTEVSLLRKMPPASRNVGYELTYLTKGDFTVEGYGKSCVCVDSRDAAILALKTEDKIYLISFDTEAEALEVIDKIEIE